MKTPFNVLYFPEFFAKNYLNKFPLESLSQIVDHSLRPWWSKWSLYTLRKVEVSIEIYQFLYHFSATLDSRLSTFWCKDQNQCFLVEYSNKIQKFTVETSMTELKFLFLEKHESEIRDETVNDSDLKMKLNDFSVNCSFLKVAFSIDALMNDWMNQTVVAENKGVWVSRYQYWYTFRKTRAIRILT